MSSCVSLSYENWWCWWIWKHSSFIEPIHMKCCFNWLRIHVTSSVRCAVDERRKGVARLRPLGRIFPHAMPHGFCPYYIALSVHNIVCPRVHEHFESIVTQVRQWDVWQKNKLPLFVHAIEQTNILLIAWSKRIWFGPFEFLSYFVGLWVWKNSSYVV